MRAIGHGLLAATLASSAGFFLYLWHESGLYCGGPLIQGNPNPPCGFALQFANFQFLSIGLLCGFLVIIESVVALKKQQRNALETPLSESSRQRKLRRTGLAVILIGFLLAVYGLYMLNTTMVNCPANGCDPDTLWAIYGAFTVSFYGGQIFIAVGALVFLSSEFARSKPQKTSEELRTKQVGD